MGKKPTSDFLCSNYCKKLWQLGVNYSRQKWHQPDLKAWKCEGYFGSWYPSISQQHYHTLLGIPSIWQQESLKEEGREKGKEGRMGRGFLTEPGAVTVWKDCLHRTPQTEDFISWSTGTGKGNRRLFPEKQGKEIVSREKNKRGRRDVWGDFLSFVGSGMGNELEGTNNPKQKKKTKHKTTKHNTSIVVASVPHIHIVISTTKTSTLQVNCVWVTVRDTLNRSQWKKRRT